LFGTLQQRAIPAQSPGFPQVPSDEAEGLPNFRSAEATAYRIR